MHAATEAGSMAPKKEKKEKAPKVVEEESPYMVALMEKTGLPKKSLLKLMDQFKKIAADTKGKGKKQTTSVNGGGDDFISRQEFMDYFSKTMKMEVADAGKLFDSADSDSAGEGMLNFHEFACLMGKMQRDECVPGSLRYAFKVLDKDGSGQLSVAELQAVLTHPGGSAPFTTEEAQAIVEKFDVNGDGELDYDEFVKAIGALRPNLGKM